MKLFMRDGADWVSFTGRPRRAFWFWWTYRRMGFRLGWRNGGGER